jgi:hypothetical protein
LRRDNEHSEKNIAVFRKWVCSVFNLKIQYLG